MGTERWEENGKLEGRVGYVGGALTPYQIQPGDIEVDNIPSSVYNGEVVSIWPRLEGNVFLFEVDANRHVVDNKGCS